MSRLGRPQALLLGSALAWIGALICLALGQAHAGGPFLWCPWGAGCHTVLTSRFAALGGVPLPWTGLAFYAAVFALLLGALATRLAPRRAYLLAGALWITLAGVTFSALLLFVQFWGLRAFCGLCTASAAVTIALLVVIARAARYSPPEFSGAPRQAMLLGLCAALTAGGFFISLRVLGRPKKIEFDLSTAAILGPRNAPVQFVVFSDFTCKFCVDLAGVLQTMRRQFPREILVAYRAYPLDDAGPGFAAAVAAHCAAEQGMFAAYHDRLFAERGLVREARLEAIAGELGLDLERFRECRHSEQARLAVAASVRAAAALGVKGAPTLFLDGMAIGGMVDAPSLERQIRARLARRRE